MKAPQSTADRKKNLLGVLFSPQDLCVTLAVLSKPRGKNYTERVCVQRDGGEKHSKPPLGSDITRQISVRLQSQVFSQPSSLTLSSFTESWYLGERRVPGKSPAWCGRCSSPFPPARRRGTGRTASHFHGDDVSMFGGALGPPTAAQTSPALGRSPHAARESGRRGSRPRSAGGDGGPGHPQASQPLRRVLACSWSPPPTGRATAGTGLG